MKTYIDFLNEINPELFFRNEEQFEDAAEAYHDYRMQQYKEQGLILLPKSLTAENGAKALLMGEFIENIQVRTNWTIKHATSWNTIKDIYHKVVEHFSEKKEFYCRKEVNKGIRCDKQCRACEQQVFNIL